VYKGTWHGVEVAVKRVLFQALGQDAAGEEKRRKVRRYQDIVIVTI
jgi:hypothetical protein